MTDPGFELLGSLKRLPVLSRALLPLAYYLHGQPGWPSGDCGSWNLARTLTIQQRVACEDRIQFMWEITRALTSSGIDFAFFKGADTALRFWPEPYLRPMADLDLLLCETQAEASLRALEPLGFDVRFQLEEWRLNPLFHETTIIRGPLTLEVHRWPLLKVRHRIDTPFLLAHRVRWEDEEYSFPMFEPTWSLFLVLVHLGISELVEQVSWQRVLDAYFILQRETVDLEELLEKAREWRCHNAVVAALLLLSRLFPALLPPSLVEREGRHRLLAASARRAFRRMQQVPDDTAINPLLRTGIKFLLLDGFALRVAMVKYKLRN